MIVQRLMSKVKLLGITVENKLSFEPNLNEICKKVSQKIHALSRFSNVFHIKN